jgi:extracellular factor (EF) 3-hydroxypalmitic acid methyl ester biosynthesis protein
MLNEPSVLIISDELKLVESLRGAFGRGCQVFLCPSVAIGLDRVRDIHLSAVLVNLQLPGLKQEDAICAIREQCGEQVMIMGFTPAAKAAGAVMPHTAAMRGGEAVALPLDWRAMRGLLGGLGSAEAETVIPLTLAPKSAEFGLFPSASPRDALPLSVEPDVEPGPALRLLQKSGSLDAVVEQTQRMIAPPLVIPTEATPPSLIQPAAFGLFDEPTEADNVIPFPSPQVAQPIAIAAPTLEEVAQPETPPTAPFATFLKDEAELLEKGNRFIARGAGEEVQGQVMRMSAHYVVCETRNPEQLLVPDWYAEEAIVYLGSREAYRGPARLSKVLNTGRSQVAEWALLTKWREDEVEMPSRTENTRLPVPAASHPLTGFFDRMRVLTQVSAVFKATIAEMASLLGEVVQCMDRIEAELPPGSAVKRAEAVRQLLPQIQGQVFGAFDDVFSRFEKVAQDIPAELAAEYHSLVRQHLHSYVMCSPFIHHIYAKPLGYAGDYGALQKLLADPFDGRTLFAKMLNAWLVLTTAGDAYRTRVKVLTEGLQTQAQICHEAGREFRTLSIGCGAANEVVEFLKNDELSNSANLTLVDFNDPTLEAAKAQITRTQREYWRLTKVRWVKQSIQGIVADELRMRRKGLPSHGPVVKAQGYEFVCCTGLLDYFSDRVCRRLIAALWSNVAPGGRLLICNFTPSNPIQHFMTYLLDWKLIYRTADELRALLPEEITAEQFDIHHSPGDVEVYISVRK